ncbi:MAG: diguanylate cyclase [Deferrisomatales bacterium]
MGTNSILIVDDDAFFRTFCADVLRGHGYEVRTAASGTEALEHFADQGASLILADIYMPEMTGLELLESVKARSPSVDVVIMTGYASIDTAIRALKRGAADYLRKPFAAEELTAVIDSTVAKRQLVEENLQLKKQLELYEVCRSFSSAETPARALDLGLEALLHVGRCEAGLCLSNLPGPQFMALAHWRGVDAAAAEAIREAFVTRGLRYLRQMDRVRALGPGRVARVLQGGFSDLREVLLVPLLHRGAVAGTFLLFRGDQEPRFGTGEADDVRFVGRQLELAYDAATRVQEAHQLAFVDTLTDLYNARYLERALDACIEEADSLGGTFSVLFLDIDYFKRINDAYGHLTGGKVLIEVSRILQANVREGDTVIRYGGDEFTVVLPHTGGEGAREVAERIRCAVREHAFLGREGRSIRLTASIGVATYPEDASTREELIDQADRAMYRGKEATRDAVYAANAL